MVRTHRAKSKREGHRAIAEIPSIRTSQVLPGKSLKFNKQTRAQECLWFVETNLDYEGG